MKNAFYIILLLGTVLSSNAFAATATGDGINGTCGDGCVYKREGNILTIFGTKPGAKIDARAFSLGADWEQVYVPEIDDYESVAIEEERFHGLSEVVVEGSIENIGSAFLHDQTVKLTLKEGIKTLEPGAFIELDCGSVVIPTSISSIGENAFNSGYTATYYCSEGQFEMCQNAGLYSASQVKSYVKSEGNYISDGIIVGSYSYKKPKRIYTLEEATKLSKPTGNRFMIRYK